MKKTFLAIVLSVLASASLSAQVVAGIQTKQQMQDEMPDSIKFVLPEFGTGRITYKDGKFSNGRLNICNIDQCVRFVDTDGSIKAVNNNDEIDRVRIGSHVFIKYGNSYVGLDDYIDDVYLGVKKDVTLLNDKHTGAFGMKSETTNIKEYSSVTSGGVTYDLSQKVVGEYKYKEQPLLVKGNTVYSVTKKRLEKLLPSKKDAIGKYIEANNPDLEKVADVRALFQAIK